MLRECEEEYARRGHFQRIFPTPFNVGLYRRYMSRLGLLAEGGVPRADLLLWEWLQLRYFATCGSERAFQQREARRVRRRVRFLRKRDSEVMLGLPSEWQRTNGGRLPTLNNFGYYCTFCGIIHYDDPIQVWLRFVELYSFLDSVFVGHLFTWMMFEFSICLRIRFFFRRG
jgi:hypothetical protein